MARRLKKKKNRKKKFEIQDIGICLKCRWYLKEAVCDAHYKTCKNVCGYWYCCINEKTTECDEFEVKKIIYNINTPGGSV